MNTKYFKTLEFDKIIAMLSSFASSEGGRILCEKLHPSIIFEDIIQAQKNTTDATNRIRTKGSLSFGHVKDMGASLKRVEIGASLSMPELKRIGLILSVASHARTYGIHSEDEWDFDSLEPIFRELDDVPTLKNEINRCIISEEEMSDTASFTLADIRRKIKQIHMRMHTELNTILHAHREYLMDAVITMRDGAYCLPIRAEFKNKVAGIIHDQSSTGSTVFIEPMAIIKLNNDIKTLQIQEKAEIEAILANLSTMVALHTKAISADTSLLSQLDFIYAKAHLSKALDANEPIFNKNRLIHLKEARHPLLDKDTVVPISLKLGDTYDLLVITGPNTGGKTVSLKTIGLFTLMGQAGLHIPALYTSELGIFEDVFADIGDEQSIEQSLSTFSGHMTKIVEILAHADTHSLCLFDELGAGTDPTEGAALAIAILNFLHRMQTRCVATTHYSELKVFALTTMGVENASCEFDIATLRPTYRIHIGVAGKSNAFAISKKLGLSAHIIEEASELIEKEDLEFEDLLTRLENDRLTIESERIHIETLKKEIEMLKRHYAKQDATLTNRKDKIIEEAKEQAAKILSEAKQTADTTIKNINKIAAGAGLGRALEKERETLRSALHKTSSNVTIKQTQPRKQSTPKELKLGDRIHVISLNLDGNVVGLPNVSGNLFVQLGILRSQVHISDIALIEEEKPTPNTKTYGGRSHVGIKSATISPEINLIGKNVDEACGLLDKYLDDALLSHLSSVRIIHGRGTGALQKGIHQYLRKLDYVKEYHLADFNDGGNAITIVNFR